jgi:hypothetical protein
VSRAAAPGLRQDLGRTDGVVGTDPERPEDVVDVVVGGAAPVPQEAPLDGTGSLAGRDRVQIIGGFEQPASNA